jgi:hypothetical protein
MDNLADIGAASEAVHLTLASAGASNAQTTVTLNNQGLIDLLQAAVTGLEPKKPYLLGLVANADGSGTLEPIAKFMSNPAGAAIVVAIGPLRKAVAGSEDAPRRYLVVAPVNDGKPGAVLQVQR